MSNFVRPTRNPKTGRFEDAEWLDDYFGKHRYGVRFSDGAVYDERDFECTCPTLDGHKIPTSGCPLHGLEQDLEWKPQNEHSEKRSSRS